MNKRSITLIIVLALIVATILYFESTKPKTGNEPIDADIQRENLHDNNTANTTTLTTMDQVRIAEKATQYPRAKELIGPEGYINTDNLTIKDHIGKEVILIDFWTYSCINCQRTLPYLESWQQKYADQGLLIIGVHTPEFDFEKDYDNLQQAVNKWNLTYPVVQDNDRQTWRAYNNHYWPRKYLIDIDGFIVYDHIGEGAYRETEAEIQRLLKERNDVLQLNETINDGTVMHDSEKGLAAGRTQETYFGYAYAREQLGNEEGWRPEETIDYTLPETKEKDLFYLQGTWKNNEDNMELISENGTIELSYKAKNVNLVAGANEPTMITIHLDGEEQRNITVQAHDLYRIVTSEQTGRHDLTIEASKGLQAYTFTFG